jgi:hypothetical protein
MRQENGHWILANLKDPSKKPRVNVILEPSSSLILETQQVRTIVQTSDFGKVEFTEGLPILQEGIENQIAGN